MTTASTASPVHGRTGTYNNRGCRCAACTAAVRVAYRQARTARYAQRVVIDGRFVALNASVHGTASGYVYWGCRCRQCTGAGAASRDRARARRRRNEETRRA